MKLRKILIFVLFIFASVFALNLSVNAAAAEVSFKKITANQADWSGKYLIVYEDGNLAFNGALTTIDASNNYIEVTINNGEIAYTDTLNAATFTIVKIDGGYTIQSASGYYIGHTADANKLSSSETTQYVNTINFKSADEIDIIASGKPYLRYNATSGQCRFRYYKSSSYTNQKAIQLYKYVEDTGEPVNYGEIFAQQATQASMFADYVLNSTTVYNYELTKAIFSYDEKTSTPDETETLNGVTWTGSEATYYGYDGTKGMQIGKSKAPITSYTITSTESFTNIKYISLNTSGASGTNATVTVTVGGTQIGETLTLTTAAADYEFISAEALNGIIQIKYEQSSAAGVFFKSIEVMNEAPTFTMETASLRFGMIGMAADLYKNLKKAGSEVSFGVAYIKATALGESTFADAITNGLVSHEGCSPVTVNAEGAEDANGEYCQFALVLTGIPAKDFDEKVTAAAYVCVDGTYYYAAETTYSVNTIAAEYVTNQTSNAMVQEHLGMLTWLQTYVGE